MTSSADNIGAFIFVFEKAIDDLREVIVLNISISYLFGA